MVIGIELNVTMCHYIRYASYIKLLVDAESESDCLPIA